MNTQSKPAGCAEIIAGVFFIALWLYLIVKATYFLAGVTELEMRVSEIEQQTKFGP